MPLSLPVQSPASRRRLHHCKQCSKKFYVRLQTEDGRLQRVLCPFCNSWNYMTEGLLNFTQQKEYPPKKKEYPLEYPLQEEGLKTAEKNSLPYRQPIADSPDKKSFPSSYEKEDLLESSRSSSASIGSRKFPRGSTSRASSIKKKYFILSLSAFTAMLTAFTALTASLYFFPSLYLREGIDKYTERIKSTLPNQIVDREGRLIAELFSIKKGNMKPHEIPKKIKDIFIFAEDKNFYEHGGIYWPSVFRAALSNLLSFSYKEGASTITQQLARILLSEREKKIQRKLKEAALAYGLERKLSKDEILAAYLNLVYLGHGIYGVENAAPFYFKKDISHLNFTQMLILASLPPAPERFSPLRHPRTVQNKMDRLVLRMRKEEFPVPQTYIEEKELLFQSLAMNRSPLENVYQERVDHAPFAVEYIRQEIGKILSKEYMYNAGLTIQTTLDLSLQTAAKKESKAFIAKKSPLFPPTRWKKNTSAKTKRKDAFAKEADHMRLGLLLISGQEFTQKRPLLQTASIGIENKTGNILFLQGGTEFGAGNQLNRTLQMHRQIGSAVKPILYALALEGGFIHSASLLDDRPIFTIENKINGPKKGYWSPVNYGGVYEGHVSVRRALSHSKNLPAIHLARLMGMKYLRAGFGRFFFPHRKELSRRFRPDDTIAIGSLEMSPLEIASAYSAFGNNGYIQKPRLILSIRDSSGQSLYTADEKNTKKNAKKNTVATLGIKVPEKRRVLSGDTAEILINLLKSASSRSRSGVQKGGFTSSFVGKTGTSNAYRDAWFVGLTPEISTAVWVGFDDQAFSMPRGTGARLAGPLWGSIMRHASHKKTKKAARFRFYPRAKAAQTCPSTGRLYTSSCPNPAKRELFRRKYPIPKSKQNSQYTKNTFF